MSEESAIGAKVDEETKRQIRVAAAKRDMNMSEFIRAAVLAEIEGTDEGNPSAMTTPS